MHTLGPRKQTFPVDKIRQLVVTSVPTSTDLPLRDREYTWRLVQGGNTGKSDTWASYMPPLLRLFRGSDGRPYLIAEVNQQASVILLYRLHGRNLQKIWGDSSKGGFTEDTFQRDSGDEVV